MARTTWIIPWLLSLALAWTSLPCFAWSNKEHIQLTRIAVERLVADPSTPDAFRQWLRQVTPGLMDMAGEERFFLHQTVGESARGYQGLLHWATRPDDLAAHERNLLVKPFGVPERKLHFVDLELLLPAGHRRGYRDDLSAKPPLEDIPPDINDPRWKEAGMLPFRVRQCYQRLVECFRDDKLHLAHEGDDDHAIRWAGYLAHYLEDNTQPQHATVDYKSQSYFADRRHAPNVHAEMEYRMVDEGRGEFLQLRKEFWPLFVAALDLPDPIRTNDPWRATLEVSLLSYDALPLIGHAAKQATNADNTLNTVEFFHFQGQLHGHPATVLPMKAHQTAWAVLRVQRLLLSAWAESRGN
jgi:hypothetical protein